MKDVAKAFGRLDILVNNAGVAVSGAVDDRQRRHRGVGPPERRQRSTASSPRSARPRKLMGEGGRIVTDRLRHRYPRLVPGLADYAATKAAIVGYSKGAARDLGPRGITVNVLQPGSIDTDMNPDDGRDFADAQRSQHALQRFGTAGRDRGRRRVPREPASLVRDRHGAQRRWRLRRLIHIQKTPGNSPGPNQGDIP